MTTKELANKIAALIGHHPHELIENADDVSLVMEKYKALLSQGKAEGFTPLIVVPSETLLEALEYAKEEQDFEAIISKSYEVDISVFFERRIKEASFDGEYEVDLASEDSDANNGEALNIFLSLTDYTTNRPYPVLMVVKIPTTNPWELAAYIPMGGFNDCPMPQEQVAVFKYWYEKYGVRPAVVSYDIWELYVEKPVKTMDDANALAMEQFGFCSDIVHQGVGSVKALANGLVNSSIWYFWWD